MTDPQFFGYGSLVNLATHDYPGAARASLRGWRRVWCPTTLVDRAFLSVIPDASSEIEGVVARVPGGDWAALDARERAYARHDVSAEVTHPNGAAIYAVAPEYRRAGDPDPVLLLSYIDVVVQGYLRLYGEAGVAGFFATTDGWGATVLDDRAAPQYPRHQRLTAEETALVDDGLTKAGATRRVAPPEA